MARKLIRYSWVPFSINLILSGLIVQSVVAQPSAELPQDLTEVGLDRLLNFDLVVTLPGRKEQRASDAASAIYVITQDDIRQSGVTHVAEVLRLVPGVDVARVSSNTWAISIRGFNQVFANKLLVLIDGVSVFSPTTNGVYWQSNDLVLEDIARIEVVRGPGAALWGSNAVNGVINIITKNAKDTQGGLITIGGGMQERGFGSARYGGKLSEETFYRAYGTFHDRAENELRAGGGGDDDWQSSSGGFRIDSQISHTDSITLSGDYQYQADRLWPTTPTLIPPFVDNQRFKDDTSWRGLRTMFDWSHEESPSSTFDTRISYSRKDRQSSLISFTYDLLNVDLQHHWTVSDRHDLVYGTAFRYFENDSEGSSGQQVDPEHRQTNLWSGFVQDEITLVPEMLRLIFGSKLEHSEDTGTEAMPNVRLAYTPMKSVSLWGSVARAVAQPAVFFQDAQIPFAAFPLPDSPLPGLVLLSGNRSLKSENLIAYEAGVRGDVLSDFSVDTSLFFNNYDDLFSAEEGEPSIQPVPAENLPALVIPVVFDNKLSGSSFGGELALEWRATDWWRLVGTYSYLNLNIDLGDSNDTSDPTLIENQSPENQFGIRSHMALNHDINVDAFLRYVDRVSSGNIDPYFDLNLRLAWNLSKNTELSVVGQNLLHNQHSEFEGSLFGPPQIEIERALYGMVRVKF